jgi:hypothetical protein
MKQNRSGKAFPFGLVNFGVKISAEQIVKNCALSEVTRTNHTPSIQSKKRVTSLRSLGLCSDD